MLIPPTPEYVAFDLETTGLSVEDDRIVEVGAVRFDPTGREIGRFESLVNPGRPVGSGATAIHGLSDDRLADAEAVGVVLARFVSFLGDPTSTTLLAHHASFDAGFLGAALVRLEFPLPGHAVVDTLAFARSRWPGAPRHRLEDLLDWLGLESAGDAHRALADSLRVKALWLALSGTGQIGAGDAPLAFAIHDPGAGGSIAPLGSGDLTEAMSRGWRVQIEYDGGSRGPAAREITPRRFVHRGGSVYLAATCHVDGREKEFRLDRIRSRSVVRDADVG